MYPFEALSKHQYLKMPTGKLAFIGFESEGKFAKFCNKQAVVELPKEIEKRLFTTSAPRSKHIYSFSRLGGLDENRISLLKMSDRHFFFCSGRWKSKAAVLVAPNGARAELQGRAHTMGLILDTRRSKDVFIRAGAMNGELGGLFDEP